MQVEERAIFPADQHVGKWPANHLIPHDAPRTRVNAMGHGADAGAVAAEGSLQQQGPEST